MMKHCSHFSLSILLSHGRFCALRALMKHYLTANTSFFVEYMPFYPIDVFDSEDVVIPCKPTSPDLEVSFEPSENVSNNDTSNNERFAIHRNKVSTLIIFVLKRLRAGLEVEEPSDPIVLGREKGSLRLNLDS